MSLLKTEVHLSDEQYTIKKGGNSSRCTAGYCVGIHTCPLKIWALVSLPGIIIVFVMLYSFVLVQWDSQMSYSINFQLFVEATVLF